MSKFTFRECRKYIEALKIKEIHLGVKGHEVNKLLEAQDLGDKVIIATSKKHRLVLVATEEGFLGFHFNENDFERMEILPSFELYQQESYNFSIFEINTQRLLLYLKSDEKTLVTLHESIQFELGLRLLKSFLSSDSVSSVIFYWSNGPLLLCYNENGKEYFFLSEARKNIEKEEALQKIRSQYKNIPCTMKAVRNNGNDEPLPEGKEEEDEMMLVELSSQKSEQESNFIEEDQESDILSISPTFHQEEEEDIRSKFEESVLISNKELPEIGVGDTKIFEKYGIVPPPKQKKETEELFALEGEKNKTPDETDRVSFSEEEKYMMEQEAGEAKDFLNQLEDSVVLRNEELEPITKGDVTVLKKYGIDIVPKGKKEEPKESPKEDGKAAQKADPKSQAKAFILNQNDVAVLAKYSVRLPRGIKSTLEEIKEAYQLAVALKKLPEHIDRKDRIVFVKFSLYVPSQPLYKRIPISYIIAPIVVLIMIYVGFLTAKFYKVSQIEKEKKVAFSASLEKVKEYKSQLEKKVEEVQAIVKKLKDNFPPQKGYPEPNPKILEKLEEVQKHIALLSSMTENGANALNKNIEEAGEYLNESKVSLAVRPYFLDQITKTYTRLETILNAAEFIHNKETEKKQLRTTCRILRENITAKEQKLKTLEENWRILQEKYPEEKAFPRRPAGAEKLLSQSKDSIKKLRQDFRNLEIAMLSDDPKALSLAEPYMNKGEEDLSALDEMSEALRDMIKICESMTEKKNLERKISQTIIALRETVDTWQKELDALSHASESLQKFPSDLNIPRPDLQEKDFIASSEKDLREIKEALQKSSQFIYQSQWNEAQKAIESFQGKSYSLSKLIQVKSNTQDALRIASSMQKSSALGKEIATLMQNTKEKLFAMEQITETLEKQVSDLGQNYPLSEGFPAVDILYAPYLSKAQSMRENLRKTVQEVETFLDKKSLDEALDKLKKTQPGLEAAQSIIPQVAQISKSLSEKITQYQKMKLNRNQIATLNEKFQKVKGYGKEIQEHLQPLDTNLKVFKKNFASEEGYPQIPAEVETVLSKGYTLHQKISETIKIAEEWEKQQEYDKAISYLDSSDVQALINRNMISDLSKYRYRVEDLLFESTAVKNRKDQIGNIKQIIEKLHSRNETLQKIVPEFSKIVETLQKEYPDAKGFLPVDPNALSALSEAKMEVKELTKVIGTGEDYLQSGRYEDALKLIAIYDNPAVTKLNFVQQMYKQIQSTLSDNQRIASDKGYREKIEKDRTEKREKAERRKKWIAPPGPWYANLSKALAIYEEIQQKLSISLQGAQGNMLYPRVISDMKEMKGMPETIAELEEMIYNIQQKNANLEKILLEKEENATIPKQAREAKNAKNYLLSRTISIEAEEEIKQLESILASLKEDLFGPNRVEWINAEKLQELRRAAQPILRQYKDAYQPVYSVFLNIETSLNLKKD
ncbi:MAG: hypothetical protein HUU50_14020 [Candidatus Brocadiae bacterium]|nr:hypothetical protein [Candidatus Brocadiia bacterium]